MEGLWAGRAPYSPSRPQTREAERRVLPVVEGADRHLATDRGVKPDAPATTPRCRDLHVTEQTVDGRPVDVYAYADRIVLKQDGEIVGSHPRSFVRNHVAYDPWHYLDVLARKPGALRNGAPFKDWELPGALGRVQRKLKAVRDGGRQMVDILTAVRTDGLNAVEAACAEALDGGTHSADVILNILARRSEPAPVPGIATPERLHLEVLPRADCARYDGLRPPSLRTVGI